MANQKKIRVESKNQSQFIRTVRRNQRWRGIPASTSDAGKTQPQFQRLKNHKLRNQPAIIHFASKFDPVEFNDSGYNAYNEYKA